MGTNQAVLLDQWLKLKGQVRQRWGKLTAEDVTRIDGKVEELAVLLQNRYGYGPAQSELEISEWLRQNELRQRSKK